MKKRLLYFAIMLLFGISGFAVRAFSANLPFVVATYLPDILWACMIYWLVAAIIYIKPSAHFTIALILTMLIEFSQLLNFEWLVELRGSPIGAYIFGVGFLISDVICYAGAVFLCFVVEYLATAKKPKVRKSKYRKDENSELQNSSK